MDYVGKNKKVSLASKSDSASSEYVSARQFLLGRLRRRPMGYKKSGAKILLKDEVEKKLIL